MDSSHDRRSLTAWVVVSLAVHAALVLSLPGMRLIETTRPEVLEVRLQPVEPPKVIPPAPALAPVPLPPKPLPKKEKEKEVRRIAPPQPAPPQEPQPTVTPRETPPAPAIIALPQADTAVRSSPSSETEAPAPRQEAPRAATAAPKADSGGAREQGAAITPPNSSAGYLRNPPPRYPVSARRNGEQGTVTLRVFVTRDGAPANVSIHRTSGSPSLDQAALDAVRGWRFAPARQGTEAVDAWVLVPIVFKLDGLS